MGKDVAFVKGSVKLMPGAPATPWSASPHQLYAGRPRRDTPLDLLEGLTWWLEGLLVGAIPHEVIKLLLVFHGRDEGRGALGRRGILVTDFVRSQRAIDAIRANCCGRGYQREREKRRTVGRPHRGSAS
jgi:hypothetical protein